MSASKCHGIKYQCQLWLWFKSDYKLVILKPKTVSMCNLIDDFLFLSSIYLWVMLMNALFWVFFSFIDSGTSFDVNTMKRQKRRGNNWFDDIKFRSQDVNFCIIVMGHYKFAFEKNFKVWILTCELLNGKLNFLKQLNNFLHQIKWLND